MAWVNWDCRANHECQWSSSSERCRYRSFSVVRQPMFLPNHKIYRAWWYPLFWSEMTTHRRWHIPFRKMRLNQQSGLRYISLFFLGRKMFRKILFDAFANFVHVRHMKMMRTFDERHFKLEEGILIRAKPSNRSLTLGLCSFNDWMVSCDGGHWGLVALQENVVFQTSGKFRSVYPMNRIDARMVRMASSAMLWWTGINWN